MKFLESVWKFFLHWMNILEIKDMDKQIRDETGEDPDDAQINPDLLDFQDKK